MSEKFTPGEWHMAVLTSRNGKTKRGISFCRVVCGAQDIAYAYPRKKRSAQKANAYLIAAAPEMYRILARLTEFTDYSELVGIIADAKSVLKKARGEG